MQFAFFQVYALSYKAIMSSTQSNRCKKRLINKYPVFFAIFFFKSLYPCPIPVCVCVCAKRSSTVDGDGDNNYGRKSDNKSLPDGYTTVRRIPSSHRFGRHRNLHFMTSSRFVAKCAKSFLPFSGISQSAQLSCREVNLHLRSVVVSPLRGG